MVTVLVVVSSSSCEGWYGAGQSSTDNNDNVENDNEFSSLPLRNPNIRSRDGGRIAVVPLDDDDDEKDDHNVTV